VRPASGGPIVSGNEKVAPEKEMRSRFAGSDDKSNQRVNYESTRAALAALGLTTAA
jgi:hypothetical protein